MTPRSVKIKVLGLFASAVCLVLPSADGQRLMDNMTDTTKFKKGVFSIYRASDRIRFSGYLQPQFQFAQAPGASSYIGGNFPPDVSNRFSMRRGRFRLDYTHTNKEGLPTVFFVYQFDGTERGFFTRDFFGRVYENKWSIFNLTTGIFPRPFGFEVNYGSSDRESPERGRMSQILMQTERDIGAMITFSPQREDHPLHFLEIDLGAFNGQGLGNPLSDFDSFKDMIGRVEVKPTKLANGLRVSGGISLMQGAMRQFTNEIHRMRNGGYEISYDSSNIGKKAPRQYYGADFQLEIPNNIGHTELRAEWITGTQSATWATSATPKEVPRFMTSYLPLYIRNFKGGYFYLLHNIISTHLQLGAKFDFYDPNTQVAGKEIDESFGQADISYSTIGLGLNYYFSDNLRLMLWYDIVRNEQTSLKDFENDMADNVFTSRLQFRF